jgi:hypothetical protein
MDIKLLFLILVIVYICYPLKEGYVGYDYLMVEFTTIFPDRNRNSGGVQFFKHIHSIKDKLTKKDYMEHHTHYCAISGSPIDPTRPTRFNHIIVDHVDGRKFVGKYYRCCTPCLADVMKYTKVEHFIINLIDGPHEHLVVTIGDPCIDESLIPNEVSSFQCSNGETVNGVTTESGRLIIGVLHEHVEYDPSTHDNLLQYSLDISEERMNTNPDELRGGMGDIFVKLAIINV